MQVTESENTGLKRTLTVVVGADELGEKFSARLADLKDRVQLKGFRKGKVPEAHLKKVYGRSVMSEILTVYIAVINTIWVGLSVYRTRTLRRRRPAPSAREAFARSNQSMPLPAGRNGQP